MSEFPNIVPLATTPQPVKDIQKAIKAKLEARPDDQRPKHNREATEKAEAGVLHLLAMRHQRRMRYNVRMECDATFADDPHKNRADEENMSTLKLKRRLLTEDIPQYLLDPDLDLPRTLMIYNPYGFSSIREGELKLREDINKDAAYLPSWVDIVEERSKETKPEVAAAMKAIKHAIEHLKDHGLIATPKMYRTAGGTVNFMTSEAIGGDFLQLTRKGQDFVPEELRTETAAFVNRLRAHKSQTMGGR